jgi:hypothetical protein
VEFDRTAGWQREPAEQWVQQHLGLRDLGRTVRLDVPHRMAPNLAALLSGWLFPEARGLCLDRGPSTPAVEFIAVPGQRDHARSPERTGSRSAARSGTSTLARAQMSAPPRRGGAGLELDLTDPRGRDRLPGDLRSGLPEAGFVNLPEAQAVVRAVEALVQDPLLRSASQDEGARTESSRLGVVALYPGQAELIRRLVQRSQVVTASGVEVRVDVPGGFREREYSVVLVSLTRSHTHRAVSYGEGPQALFLALTRARARLVLVGDPGTLARRAQWETAVDHLDENASARERAVVQGLVDYLHGSGPHPQAFTLREGSGA